MDQTISMTQTAYLAIERDIVSLRIEPGSMLSEGELCERYGIGRTPVRDALQRLQREGLVDIRPRRGVQVTQVNVIQQLSLIEARRPLEQLLAKCAAMRADNDTRVAMLALAEKLESVDPDYDNDLFLDLNRQSHRIVAKASKNDVLISLYGLLHGLSRRFWCAHYKEFADLSKGAGLHAAILRAIAAGDAEAAGERGLDLIEYLEAFARRVINREVVK